MPTRLIYDPDTLPAENRAGLLGGKAAGLLQLQQQGHLVPPFFVILTAALQSVSGFPVDGPENCASDDDLGAMRKRLDDSEFSPELKSALREVTQDWFAEGTNVAVRSSAVAEDGERHSFAGIYDSILGVRAFDELCEAVRQVWCSALGPRAVTYRRQMGLPPVDVRMAVVVQQMVNAQCAGVCFTCNPQSDSAEEVLIQSVPGLGEGLVSRGLPADSFVVSKQNLEVSIEIAAKQHQWLLDEREGGLRCADIVEEGQRRPSLSDEQVRQVAHAAMTIESEFGCPQDVEFCFDAEGELFILQSRPITSRLDRSDPGTCGSTCGNQLVWDNSNIIESYSGVTTPMTFSFIRRAYSIVYHCFADVMGISPRVVREHHNTFENMLGLFRGRVYYNLKNWYRLVRLFPGYEYNRRFMESMMGLKDPLLLHEQSGRPGTLRRWFVEFPGLITLLLRSGWNFLFLRSKVEGFHRHFQQHFEPYSQVDFDALPPHEILQAYAELEDALLWNWKAPIINDFYVMVFYGLLKQMCIDWCNDESGSLQNGLICGEGGLQSDEPARLLLQMARVARDDDALRRLLLEEPVESLPALIAADPRFETFHRLMRQYLDEYGLRCVGELKLEELSYRDQPHRLYQLIRDYLTQDGEALRQRSSIRQHEQSVRADAEQQCLRTFSKSPRGMLRRMLFRRVLGNARIGIRNRENMRFARTRIYGLLRSMLRSIGRQFTDEGLLDNRDDVFYLTIDEVRDFVQGTAVSTDLRGLAQLRRAEYDAYRDGSVPAPDNRFVTSGIAYHGNSFQNHRASTQAAVEDVLSGVGCCPGGVTGRVQVIRDPSQHTGFQGDILVAERTDPGWVPLYPAFSGILIERGSVLSHSAIVAREMGIPTIVGIPGLTERLHSGQQVRMDGRTGTVEIVEAS